MEPEGTKKILYGKPKRKLLWLSLVLGIMGYCIWWHRDYFVTLLIKPVHLTSEEEGAAFLRDKRFIMGDLKDLPAMYVGYDVMWSYLEDGEKVSEFKGDSIYYTYIDNRFVLCEYANDSEQPEEILSGAKYMCYKMEEIDTEQINEVKYKIVEESDKTQNPISPTDFSDESLLILTPGQVISRKIRAVFILIVALIFFRTWVKTLVPVISVKLCKGVRAAIKRYGSLREIYAQIEGETCLVVKEELLLTDNWLVHGGSKDIINCNDIIWLYHKQYALPIIEYTKTYIYTKDNKKHCLMSWNLTDALQVYDKIIEKRPNIIEGYSKSLYSEWKENPERFIKSRERENEERSLVQKKRALSEEQIEDVPTII